MSSKYFVLYQDCYIITGAKNTLLCDIYRQNIIDITSIYNQFKNLRFLIESPENLELINYLISQELGYIIDKLPTNIDGKKIEWFSPSPVNEVIIEHKKKDEFDINKAYSLIETLSVSFLQIRFLEFSLSKLQVISKLLKNSCIRTIEIILPYVNEDENSKIINFLRKNKRVQIIYFYNAPFNKSEQETVELFNIVYYKKNLTNEKFCGIINEDYFTNDIKNFSKAHKFNSCLKDKLFISYKGDLKNCPSLQRVITNINDFSFDYLITDINNDEIRNITKDQINICKDCEYRYFCNDCRAYKENPNDSFSKPLKCGYDPYKGEWDDWTKNPLKQKTIKYYGLEETI